MSVLRTIWVLAVMTLLSIGDPAAAMARQAGSDASGLLDQAQSMLVSDTEAGLALVRRASEAERSAADPRSDVLLRASWLEGEALFRLGLIDEAADHLRTAIESRPAESSEIYGKLLIASGRVARARGDDGRALRNFQDAFAVFSEINSRRYMAISLQALGTLYQNAGQYERAIEYIERSTAIYPDDPMLRIAGLNNRANAYRFLGREEEARRLFGEALASEAVQSIPSLGIRILSNSAAFEAEVSNDRGARLAVERINDLVAENALASAPLLAVAVDAALLHNAGRSAEALDILDRAFADIDLSETSEDAQEAHQFAYQVYRDVGRADDALRHLEAFKRLDDIERDIAASANLAILNAEFELSNKELEIATLRSERLETEFALIGAKRRQEQLITGAIILLAIGVSSFFVWQTMQSGRVRRITERLNRELESVNQKLRISNVELEKASSAKTEFLATTSHEVRTPLNAVINLTANVLEKAELDNASYEKLSTALKSAEHLHDIVSDVLDVARFEGKRVRAHLTEVDLCGTVNDVINLWRTKAEEKRIEFRTDIDIACPSFRTDDKLLRQLLSNLLSNAIKFTSEGQIGLSVNGGGSTPIRIAVSDTGIGIDEAHQGVIFESFRQVENTSTRSFAGTGLGLAISRQIAELLGGSITVESAPGVGTTFTVTLPVHPATAETAEPEPEAPRNNADVEEGLRHVRVLAAEDNAVNAMVIQAILKGKVQALTIVENGLEAVNAVIDGDFDVVLMDKQMPVMDGVEAIRRIRTLGGKAAQTPIIAVTADAFAEARDELFEVGADDYLSKPIKPDDLKRSIVSNLREGARSGKTQQEERAS